MARDNEINLSITADDQASKVIDDVADELDRLDDGVDVDVDADTTDALSRIQKFETELSALSNPDAIELRVEFRQQVIQGEIRKALRQLERLEDPVEIDIAQRDLERAQTDLRELADLADRKYQIDVEVDPKRNAQRAASDLGGLNNAAEGFQSGLPALRGFGDELGGVAQQAGVAGQAVGDLGDFALIAGERFGLSSGLATGLGTALGGAGLAAVVGGVLFEAYQKLNSEQEINLASAEELLGVQEALAEGNREAAARELAESYSDVIAAGREFGFDAGDTIRRITADVYGFAGANKEAADSNVAGWEAYKDAVNTARGDFGDARQTFEDTAEAAALIGPALGDNVAGGAEEAILAIKKTEDGMILLEAAQKRLGEDATPEELVEEYQKIQTEVEEFGRSAADAGRDADAGLGRAESAADDAADAIDDARDSTDDWTGALGRLDDEAAKIRLDDKFADAREEADLTRLDIIELTQDVADYAAEVLDVPTEIVSQFVAQADPQSLADVERLLDELSADQTQTIRVLIRDEYGRRIDNGPVSRNPDGSYAPIIPDYAGRAVTNNFMLPNPTAVELRDQQRRLNRYNGGGGIR